MPPELRDPWSGMTIHETLLVESQRAQDAVAQDARSALTYQLVGVFLLVLLLQWVVLPLAKRTWPKGLGGRR